MKRTSAESPSEPTMPPTQTFHEGGKFVFRAGLVPTDFDHCVILHRNKNTLEPSLPQGPCEWLLKPGAGDDSVPVLESFEATAVRIRNTQLSYKSRMFGHHPKESPQPYSHKSGSRPKMTTPFLLQTEITPDGTLEVTAWFQVLFDESDPERTGITAFARGNDWAIELFEVTEALELLSAGEQQVLSKAMSTQETYCSDDDDEDFD